MKHMQSNATIDDTPEGVLMRETDKASLVLDLLGAAAGLMLIWGWIYAGWISHGPRLVLFPALILFLVAPVRLYAKLWGIRVAGAITGCLASLIGVLLMAFAVVVLVWELHWTDLDRLMSVRGDVILFSFALGCLLLLKVYFGFRRRVRQPKGP